MTNSRSALTVLIISISFTTSSCRGVYPGLEERVSQEWAAEDTAEICHYLYWPIPDPTASKDLKLLDYSIMQAELDKRGVHCLELFPDNEMYEWQSMLEKLLD